MSEPLEREWVGWWGRIPDIKCSIMAHTRSAAKRILSLRIHDAYPKPDWRELHVKLAQPPPINWQWKAGPLELLKRDPGAATIGAETIALLEALPEQRAFHWLHALISEGQAIEWALGVLSKHVKPGDNAPMMLRPGSQEFGAFLMR